MSSTITEARPEAFTGSPEQILTDVIHQYGRQVQASIGRRLGRRDPQLAEDLTQEVFIRLWRFYIAPGTALDERLPALLSVLGKQVLCQHFNRRRNHETALDFTDPEQPAARTLAAPASDTPHLADLFGALETAKHDLEVIAADYRAVHRAHLGAQRGLRCAVQPEAVTRCTARVERLARAERLALDDFQAAAEDVAAYRAAWNSAAGEQAGTQVLR